MSSTALFLQDRLRPVEAVRLPEDQDSVHTLLFDPFLIMFFDIMVLLRLAISMTELFMLVLVMFMIYIFQNLIEQLPNYSTIQNPYYRQSVDFSMTGFADALRSDKFTGVHFER